MKRLEGKVAIITGAAQGLGEALAIRLGQEGAKVVVADMNYEGAQKVAAQLPEAIAVPLNVCDPAQCGPGRGPPKMCQRGRGGGTITTGPRLRYPLRRTRGTLTALITTRTTRIKIAMPIQSNPLRGALARAPGASGSACAMAPAS